MDEIIKIDVECYSPFICLGCPAFELEEHTLYANDEPYEKSYVCAHLNLCKTLVPHLDSFFENKYARVARTAEPKVYYLCDRRVCDRCLPMKNACRHTANIRHAKNFQLRGDVFREQERADE